MIKWGYSLTLMENTSRHPRFRIAQSHIVDIMGVLWGFYGDFDPRQLEPQSGQERLQLGMLSEEIPPPFEAYTGHVSHLLWFHFRVNFCMAHRFRMDASLHFSMRFPKSWGVPYLIRN